MGARCRIELFGGLCVQRGERIITRFRTQKNALLLAYLACYPQRAHPRECLIELLWPEAEPGAGRNRLRQELASLRRQLESPGMAPGRLLHADRSAVRLNPHAFTTDVADFEAAVQAAKRAAPGGERTRLLAEAVARYGGELLPGYYEEWVIAERDRLADDYLQTLRLAVQEFAKARDLPRALEYAKQAVRADPLREELHRDLMRLYTAASQPGAALRQYQELERLLRERLDAAPSASTRRLMEQTRERAVQTTVSVRDAPPAAIPAPPTSPPVAPSLQLPVHLTRFFGREEDIVRLQELLGPPSPHRLVTLTGAGGSGKTRLAIEAARKMAAAFSGGVCFVSLADLADARLIAGTIVDALALQRSSHTEPLEQVVEFFNAKGAQRAALLVLDNFEHLVEEGAFLVRALLHRVASLRCLVTSRQRLHLQGERDYAVSPLPIPVHGSWFMVDGQADDPSTINHQLSTLASNVSVALFVDRAQAARHDFEVIPENAAAVAELCHRLEGIPLTIELAAAQTHVLTPAQMLSQIEQRLDAPGSRFRDMEPRHRTLRTAIDWSSRLLTPELQRLFARLSVFCGGWTLEAVEAVCEEPCALHFLTQLRGCSLIQTEERGDAMRFRMLETLREYAEEQLPQDERAVLHQRHTNYYLALAEQAESNLKGAEQAEWLDRLETEHDNFRAALKCCMEEEGQNSSLGLRLAAALGTFWSLHGHLREGRTHLAALLAREEAAGATAVRAKALNEAGKLADDQGDYAAARSLHEKSLAISRELENRRDIASSLGNLGNVALHQGDYAAARALHEESLAMRRALGNRLGIASSLGNLGYIAYLQGNNAAARSLHEESLAIKREFGNQWGIAASLNNLGLVAYDQGDHAAAQALHEEAMAIRQELGDRQGIATSFGNLGLLAKKQGDYLAARAHYEECLAIFRELGDKWGIAAGLGSLATIAHLQGDLKTAYALRLDSLEIERELGSKLDIARSLEGFASIAVAQGRFGRAARLLGAAESLRDAIGAPLPANERAAYDGEVAGARAALGAEAFAAARAEGRAMMPELAVEYVLGDEVMG